MAVGLGRVEQRVVGGHPGVAELADQPEQGLGVRLGRHGGLLGPGELARRDHLHRARDALDVPDRLHAHFDFAALSHRPGS